MNEPSLISRRALLGSALAAPMLAPLQAGAQTAAAEPGAPNWTLARFLEAMRESGRPITMSQQAFNAIQARKPAALKLIETYLTQHLGHADPAVMQAFAELPREYYHYNYEDHVATPSEAYEAKPKPWAIGYGSALSDYLGQAYMTQVCAPKPGDITLEIGTGSGYQSSLLSRIAAESYSIEIIEPLGRQVAKIFKPLGYDNIQTRVGDGYYGWPEVQGGFDIIIVTCAAQYAPPDLFKQLKPGGRMVIPIGQPFKRGQVLYVYHKDQNGKIHSRRDMGVYFIPMTGRMMSAPRPANVT